MIPRRADVASDGRGSGPTGDRPVLLVTGASGGIGAAIARAARADGHRLVLVSRSAPTSLAEELGGPEHALAVRADVTDEPGLAAAVRAASGTFGGIHAVVANAGINAGPSTYRPQPGQPDAAKWRAMVLVNVLGTALTVRAVSDALVATSGRLVLTGSVLGRYAMAASLYSATKFAVAGIAESARLELAGSGVSVTLLQPGPVDTGFGSGRESQPGARRTPALSAEDVARAAMFVLDQPPGVDVNELLVRPHGATP